LYAALTLMSIGESDTADRIETDGNASCGRGSDGACWGHAYFHRLWSGLDSCKPFTVVRGPGRASEPGPRKSGASCWRTADCVCMN